MYYLRTDLVEEDPYFETENIEEIKKLIISDFTGFNESGEIIKEIHASTGNNYSYKISVELERRDGV